MQKPQFVNCEECRVLLNLYEQVDCSIANLIKNRYSVLSYSVSLFFDGNQYSDLIRYKRILYRKITNSSSVDISDQQLVKLITKELYKIGKCPKCPC